MNWVTDNMKQTWHRKNAYLVTGQKPASLILTWFLSIFNKATYHLPVILLITGYPGGVYVALHVFKWKDKAADEKNWCTHSFLGHFFHPTSLYLNLCIWFQYCLFWTRLAPADTGGRLLFLPWSWPLFLFYLICKSPLEWIQESVVSRLGTLKAIQIFIFIACTSIWHFAWDFSWKGAGK